MEQRRKNILLLIADDLGKFVGCYGCESIKTPNLDKLGREGVRFDNAFASTASRSFLPLITSNPSQNAPADWPQEIFGSHTFHEMQNYWPTRILRTPRYKYHRNIAWRLDFPFAADLYASRAFEEIRNMPAPVMVGTRTLKNYIFRPAEELYDLEQDPQEVRNLTGDEKYRELLLEMREKVTEWQKQTGDLWLYRDGQSVTGLSRYAKDGLEVPERLDFDVERPGTEGVVMTRHLDKDAYSAGIKETTY